MQFADFHVHTVYCDGHATPRENIEAAIEKNMYALGFSGHCYTSFDLSYCMKDTEGYMREIRALADEYRDRIPVYCGVELDGWSDFDVSVFDYRIGSVHYIRTKNGYFPIDEGADIVRRTAQSEFGGDIYAYCESYYRSLAELLPGRGVDIIGHYDLVSKFNENGEIFDPENPRYIRAWQECADELLKMGVPFEVNTGAISRKKRTTPYPAHDMLLYLRDRGAKFILSGDAHRPEHLCYEFEKWSEELKKLGITPLRLPLILSAARN